MFPQCLLKGKYVFATRKRHILLLETMLPVPYGKTGKTLGAIKGTR